MAKSNGNSALPMNLNMVRKKPVLTPTLSSEERETVFPRIGKVGALDWNRFKGSMRECFGENSSRGRRNAPSFTPRRRRVWLKDSGKMHPQRSRPQG